MSDKVQNQSEVTNNPSDAGVNQSGGSNQNWDRVNKTIEQLGQNQLALQHLIANSLQKPRTEENSHKDEGPVTVDDDRLESMSRREFMNTIEANLVRAMGKSMEPIVEKVGAVEQNVSQRNLQQQVDTAKASYKDFEAYKQDMLALHNTKGYDKLSVDDLYHLARAKDPSKMYKEPKPEPKEEPFRGLFPSAAIARDSNVRNNMSFEDAFDAAYERIFES